MDAEMKRKIDSVLDRVKEPESGLSIAQIGLVKKLRYNPTRRRLYIFNNQLRPNRKQCCTVIQGLLLNSTLEALKNEFRWNI
jgi:metal-sulfur cluster biosynthetic enzyme